MGGQTALNCALDLERYGVLEKHSVEMIGAKKEAINKAEDRDLFREAMLKIAIDSSTSNSFVGERSNPRSQISTNSSLL
jgi:carbamoylphosphate synthase large subunit